MNTEILDKLYLEWSQFTKARTPYELFLERRIKEIVESKSWEAQVTVAEATLAAIKDRNN